MKKRNKLLAYALIGTMMLQPLLPAANVQAEELVSSKGIQTMSSNQFSTAVAMKIGDVKTGSLLNGDTMYYKFTIPTGGMVTFNVKANEGDSIRLRIFDANQEELDSRVTRSVTFSCAKGTYYLEVSTTNVSCKSYSLSSSFLGASDSIGNHSFSTAKAMTIGTVVKSNVALNQEYSYYKFSLPTAGVLSVNLSSDTVSKFDLDIFDSNQEEVDDGVGKKVHVFSLAKGIYYIRIKKSYGTIYGNFDLKTGFESAANSINNTSFSRALPIAAKKPVVGNLSPNQEQQVYSFTAGKKGVAKVKIESDYIENAEMALYDKNQKRVDWFYGKTSSFSVNPGKYYLVIKQNRGYGNFKLTVDAPIKTISSKTTLSGVKASKGKKMKVSWKANQMTSNYYIQYSRDKKFQKGVKTVKVSKKTSLTVKKLKKNKRYYVRVCGVKDGKRLPWSNVKSVKIKK